MIVDNAARLKTAQELLLRFIAIGRTGDAKHQAALRRSLVG